MPRLTLHLHQSVFDALQAYAADQYRTPGQQAEWFIYELLASSGRIPERMPPPGIAKAPEVEI